MYFYIHIHVCIYDLVILKLFLSMISKSIYVKEKKIENLN